MEQARFEDTEIPLKKLRCLLLQGSILFSILSQMPLLRLEAGIATQLIIYPGWLLLAGVTFVQGIRMRQRFLMTTIIPSLIWILFAMVFEVWTGNRYFTSGLSFQFYMALFLTWIGYANSDVLFQQFQKITHSFLAGSILLGVDIYWEFFREYNLTTIDYIFRSKNSAAFILLIAMILAVVDWSNQSFVEKNLRIAICIFFTYLCIVMRSRAVLLGVITVILYWGYSSPKKASFKLIFTLLVSSVLVVVWYYEPLYELVIQNMFLNGSTVSNLNEVSSNRLEYFTVVQSQMNELLLGIGEYYMDNFYLESILNNGWLLGSFLIILAILPLRMLKFGMKRIETMDRFLTIVVIVHLLNAVFEGYAPFGPGTKCMILWLFYGAWQYRKERRI